MDQIILYGEVKGDRVLLAKGEMTVSTVVEEVDKEVMDQSIKKAVWTNRFVESKITTKVSLESLNLMPIVLTK